MTEVNNNKVDASAAVNNENSAAAQNEKSKEPDQIGDFTIGKTLGKGTFGKVKLGTHILTKEKAAIKILDKQMIKDASDLERVNREIAILKKLRHPHVVQLFDIIENDRYLFLIMEYCSGDQLFKQIRKQKFLKEEDACKFYQQLISGLEYIHKIGIVHRDLKPENILLDHNNDVKLVDFGLGNLYKEGQMLKTACGSPCYAAPEMIKGLRYHGLMTDIWSSGVVLFAMVAGYLPFEDKVTSKLYEKIQKTEYTMPTNLSENLKHLIRKILVVDPQQRYTVEDIRRHPWYSLVAPTEKSGTIIGKTDISVDDKILDKVQKEYQYNTEKVKTDIKRNKFNSATTIYYMLLKRSERSGLYRKQFSLDFGRKRNPVNVQMVINQQTSLNQPQPLAQPVAIIEPSQDQDGPQQNIDFASKRRQEHSTDVRQHQQYGTMVNKNANYMSSVNQDNPLTNQDNKPQLQNQQQQQQQQYVVVQNGIDPFAKVNPKAKMLIESAERRGTVGFATQDRRNDSTGGSGAEYADFVNGTQSPPLNARNHYGSIQTNQNEMEPTSRTQYSSQYSNNVQRNSSVGNKNQTQTGFYNPNGTGRQQMPTPSYQNYLFSEKITPSHYKSPIQLQQMYTPVEQNNQLYIKSSTIKYNANLKNQTKQPSQIIQQLQTAKTGQITPSNYARGKSNNVVSEHINHSFQIPPSNQRGNDSIDIDMYVSPKAFGQTTTNFGAKQNYLNTVRGGQGPLQLQITPGGGNGQPPIQMRNHSHHAKHNSYTGPGNSGHTPGYMNIQQIVQGGGQHLRGIMNQQTLEQAAFNRSSITAEEIAALYSNVVATQNIIHGKRTGNPGGVIHKKLSHNLNQTFY